MRKPGSQDSLGLPHMLYTGDQNLTTASMSTDLCYMEITFKGGVRDVTFFGDKVFNKKLEHKSRHTRCNEVLC